MSHTIRRFSKYHIALHHLWLSDPLNLLVRTEPRNCMFSNGSGSGSNGRSSRSISSRSSRSSRSRSRSTWKETTNPEYSNNDNNDYTHDDDEDEDDDDANYTDTPTTPTTHYPLPTTTYCFLRYEILDREPSELPREGMPRVCRAHLRTRGSLTGCRHSALNEDFHLPLSVAIKGLRKARMV